MYSLSTMTVAEFKIFKRAVRILVSAGLTHEDAVNILTQAREQRAENRIKRFK